MKVSWLAILLCVLTIPHSLQAQTNEKSCAAKWLHCSSNQPVIYHPENDRKTGEMLRGPRKIVATDINRLRYDYVFSTETTYQQATTGVWATLTGMALTLPTGAPAVTPAPTKQAPGTGGLSPTPQYPPAVQALLSRFGAIQSDDSQRFATLSDYQAQVTNNSNDLVALQSSANAAVSKVNLASANLTNFLGNTNGVASQLIPEIKGELLDATFTSGLGATWPSLDDVSSLQTKNTSLQNSLSAFKVLYDPFVLKQNAALALLQQDCQTMLNSLLAQKPVDQDSVTSLNDEIKNIPTEQTSLTDNSSLLQWEIAQNNAVAGAIPALLSSSPNGTSFTSNQTLLGFWRQRMSILVQNYNAFHDDPKQENPLERSTYSSCEFSFGGGKTNAVTLARTDRLPGTTQTTPETILSVTIQCSSPISISAGVAFDTIGEKTFGIQAVPTSPMSTTTSNVFVLTSQSSFHPVPIGMVNARLCELNDKISLHFSFGVAAGIKSQDSGGSSAEYLIGPSLGLFRTVFLTPGLYIGQTASLSGYKVGDPVPSTVTSPPLRTSYTPGFGFAITFTKP